MYNFFCQLGEGGLVTTLASTCLPLRGAYFSYPHVLVQPKHMDHINCLLWTKLLISFLFQWVTERNDFFFFWKQKWLTPQEFIWFSLWIEFMGCWLRQFVGLDSWFLVLFAVLWGPIFRPISSLYSHG